MQDGVRRHSRIRQEVGYGRYEAVELETDLLRFASHNTGKLKRRSHVFDDLNRTDLVQVLTLGAVRVVSRWRGWDVGAGGDVTGYGVPSALEATHGRHPVSFHLFVRIRPPQAARLKDVTMIRSH